MHEQGFYCATFGIWHTHGDHVEVLRITTQYLFEPHLDRSGQAWNCGVIACGQLHRHVQQHALGCQCARERNSD